MQITMTTALNRIMSGKSVFYRDFSAFYQVKSITVSDHFHSLELGNGHKLGSIANNNSLFYNQGTAASNGF